MPKQLKRQLRRGRKRKEERVSLYKDGGRENVSKLYIPFLPSTVDASELHIVNVTCVHNSMQTLTLHTNIYLCLSLIASPFPDARMGG